MTFGISITNEAGDIVIDGEYQNHVIAEVGSAMPSVVNFSGSYDINARQPLVFARCTGDHIGQIDWLMSGNNVTGFRCAGVNGGVSFDWKLAVRPSGPSADANGMRVFDGSGKVVFDSGLPYLNVVDALSYNATTFPVQTLTHASAGTPFYCLTTAVSYGVRQVAQNFSGSFVAAYKAIDATHVGQSWAHFGSDIQIVTGVQPRPATPRILVADAAAVGGGSGHGIEIYSVTGARMLSMSSRLTRFLFHSLVAAGASGSQAVADLVASRCIGFAVGRSMAFGKVPHDVTLIDGQVSWAPPSVGSNVQSDIYVVQYR